MNKWLKVILPVAAVVVVVGATAAWGLPRALAAISGPAHSVSNLVGIPQLQPGDKPFLGVRLANINEQIKNRLQLPAGQGVVVIQIMKDSPAATAGLQEKDVITAVDGKAVTVVEDVTGVVQAKKPGDTLTLSVLRAGQTSQQITATLGSAPVAPARPLPPKIMAPGGLLPKGLGGLLGPGSKESFRSATITLTDKDGKERTVQVVAGAVQSATSGSISVVPNGAQSAITFEVTPETRVGRGRITDLKSGDRVVVVAEAGKATSIANLTGKVEKSDNRPRGPFNFPFHRFLPGRNGPQTP